ncbi:hypothetical protein [Sedimentitalea todarodis]|uniref:Uncharacterized protein n=1 Tax=Sedimentitalea todarodis TaxID=1631240 RepID=A0ABU3VH32_9RHOB|nr:hypothetical protein [Sedimentitalea todarodis]MDU9005475.1 hypothetical protein [Sedimentitalea todarodis]
MSMMALLTMVCRLGAGLCLADALLIIGSALGRGNGQAIVISFVVGIAYIAAVVVLLGLARAIRRIDAEEMRLGRRVSTAGLQDGVRVLAAWLLVAASAAAIVSVLSLVAILQRVSEGFAVFG